jgi:GNAT superfamily N-acetyltransferase
MHVARLPELDQAQVRELAAIYEEAFPPRERMPLDELLGTGSGGRTVLALLDGGEVVGLASLDRIGTSPVALLEYFAVARGRRGGGLGQELWGAVIALAARPGLAVVLEVEDPAEPGTSPAEADLRRRRIRFYERGGARVLPVSRYRVPDLAGAGDLPMLLMWASPTGGDPPTGGELDRLLRDVYKEAYGLAADHPLVRGAVANGRRA